MGTLIIECFTNRNDVENLIESAWREGIIAERTNWIWNEKELTYNITFDTKEDSQMLISYLMLWLPEMAKQRIKFYWRPGKPNPDFSSANVRTINKLFKEWK
jgi:hypothetical protein